MLLQLAFSVLNSTTATCEELHDTCARMRQHNRIADAGGGGQQAALESPVQAARQVPHDFVMLA